MSPTLQRTLILLKPDAVQRGFCGDILGRFERKGLQIVGLKFMTISQAVAAQHYEAHKERPFYAGLVRFMTSSPVVAVALAGKDAVTIARNLMGATFGSKAAPGTIRGDYGVSNAYNLVHGSDSPEAGEREIGLFFKPDEVVAWTPTVQPWVYDMTGGAPE